MSQPVSRLRLTGATRLAAVIGHPVRHSLSPAIFNAAFAAAGLDWAYLAFEVAVGDAGRALDGMRSLGLGGLSITMPHKEAVAELVDRCSDDAAALGAVNCVVPVGGTLVGENTDGPGFVASLQQDAGFDPSGRRCVVIGAGGAARAVTLALARAGAAEVAIANRTPSKADRAAALAGDVGRVIEVNDPALRDADLVVNGTPVGMLDDHLPVDPELLRPGQVVADLVYHPLETPLVQAAAAVGAVAINGLGMLVHQAGYAFTHWTGEIAPIAAMRSAADAEISGKS